MLIRSNMDVWKHYVEHDFVKQLGQGTLPRERFIHFLKCASVAVPSDPMGSLINMGDHTHRAGRIISTSNITLEQTGTHATADNTNARRYEPLR